MSNGPIRSSDGLDIPLLPWQQAAIDQWILHGGRGIIEAATGAGKTRVALGAIRVAQSVWESDLRVVVVVPTKVLLYQWDELLRLWVAPKVGLLGDGHRPLQTDTIVVAIINSARSQLPRWLKRWRDNGWVSLAVVDECHRAGALRNSEIFNGPIDLSMGLSATPDREGDSATDEVLIPHLGDVIVTYDRANAENDGVIAPVDLIDIVIELDPEELDLYVALSDKIRQLTDALMERYPQLRRRRRELVRAMGDIRRKQVEAGKLPDAMFDEWTQLVMKRRRVLASARERQHALRFLLERLGDRGQGFLFHEEITQAEATAQMLRSKGRSVGVYHSEMKEEDREAVIGRFRAGQMRWISCVRALDEGVDVPDATTAVIVAGSFSRRQLIQRLGRVSRKHADARAVAYRITVKEEVGRSPKVSSAYGIIEWPQEAELLREPLALQERLQPAPDWLDDDDETLGWGWQELPPSPPKWSASVDGARNLTIPIADRVISASLRQLLEGLPVVGPARAVESPRRSVEDAVRQQQEVRSRLLDPLDGRWRSRLNGALLRLEAVLDPASTDVAAADLHGSRTLARHVLEEYDDALAIAEPARTAARAAAEQGKKASEARRTAKDEAIRKRISNAHADGAPVEVYVRDVTGATATVTVRRSLIQATVACPEDAIPDRHDILLARVETFDPVEMTVTLSYAGRKPR